jgi:FAD synthetase
MSPPTTPASIQDYQRIAQVYQFPPLDLRRIEANVYAFVPPCDASSLPVAAFQRLGKMISQAVAVIESALDRFPLSSLALSFNGGKDCTVLLYLVRAVVYRKQRQAHTPSWSLPTVFVTQDNAFPEEVAFVAKCASRYVCEDVLPSRVSHAGSSAGTCGTSRVEGY